MARVLLTGFGNFNDQINHTSQIAEAVTAAGVDGADILTATLPVDWYEAPVRLEELVRKFEPRIVLNLGLSSNAPPYGGTVIVERYALNWAFGLDVNKRTPTNPPLTDIPDRASLDLGYPGERIAARIQEAGIAANYSDGTIGVFLCNDIALRARLLVDAERAEQSGFLHLPPTSSLDADSQVRAVSIAVASCLEGPGTYDKAPYLRLAHSPIIDHTLVCQGENPVVVSLFRPDNEYLVPVKFPDTVSPVFGIREAADAIKEQGGTAYFLMPDKGGFPTRFFQNPSIAALAAPLTPLQLTQLRGEGLLMVPFDAAQNRVYTGANTYAERMRELRA